MYIPSSFAENRPEVLRDFIRGHGFGTLVALHPEQGLWASHLPFMYSNGPAGAHGTLWAHVARQNDQWKCLSPDRDVLAIFSGPHAYISPRWYQATAVPTWNYTAVHVYGRPRIIEDAAAVRHMLTELVATYEGTGPQAWKLADVPADFLDRLQAGIVAFAIEVTRIEGKFKLSQNRSAADRHGAVAGLQTTGNNDDLALADLMLAQLASPTVIATTATTRPAG